jgi:hypothetical protein
MQRRHRKSNPSPEHRSTPLSQQQQQQQQQQHNEDTGGYNDETASAVAAKAAAHSYAFGRPLHADYSATERSFYYRDSLGTNSIDSTE